MTDPKPDLSRAAIMSNIDYCHAMQEHYLALVKQFEQKEQEYVKMLARLTANI
jgi:hypothetical protein